MQIKGFNWGEHRPIKEKERSHSSVEGKSIENSGHGNADGHTRRKKGWKDAHLPETRLLRKG